ncbi:hypothetical protein JCM10003_2156 [Bacteroides pyogenes JCM 10003]|nr:hypothetical protein JCM10003_2156 [Bacteroides pyogenes JCM 10003]
MFAACPVGILSVKMKVCFRITACCLLFQPSFVDRWIAKSVESKNGKYCLI